MAVEKRLDLDRREPTDARERHRLARLDEQIRAVVAGAAVDAETDRHAGVEHPAHRRDPRGEPHVAARTVRDAGAGAREEIDAARVELTQCACKPSRPTQTSSAAYSDGVAPKCWRL